MVVAWSLTPSHSGLFALKIRGLWAIVIEASCFTSIRVFSPPATFSNFSIASGTIRASSMEIKRRFMQSIHANAEDSLLLEILPTKRASITIGLVFTRVLPALDVPSNHNQRVCLQYEFVHNGSNFPKQLAGWNVLHSTPIFQKTLMVLTILSKSGSFADGLDINLSQSSQWRNTHWTRLDKCQGPPGSRGPQAWP